MKQPRVMVWGLFSYRIWVFFCLKNFFLSSFPVFFWNWWGSCLFTYASCVYPTPVLHLAEYSTTIFCHPPGPDLSFFFLTIWTPYVLLSWDCLCTFSLKLFNGFSSIVWTYMIHLIPFLPASHVTDVFEFLFFWQPCSFDCSPPLSDSLITADCLCLTLFHLTNLVSEIYIWVCPAFGSTSDPLTALPAHGVQLNTPINKDCCTIFLQLHQCKCIFNLRQN